jgi:hypothetical protein
VFPAGHFSRKFNGLNGQCVWLRSRSNVTMRKTTKQIVACVGIGQCEDVIPNGQFS